MGGAGRGGESLREEKMASDALNVRSKALKGHVQKLNASFLAWVKKEVEAHESSSSPALLSHGVREYMTHSKGLLEEFKDVVDGGSGGGGAEAKASQGGLAFAFGGQKDDAKKEGAGGITGFSFGGSGNGGAGGFSFGAGAATTTTSSSPATNGAPAPFSFGFGGGAAATSFPDPAKSNGEEAPKKAKPAGGGAPLGASSEGDDGAKPAFEAKSKVFRWAPAPKNEWRDTGVGFTSVVPSEGGKAFICFRNVTTGKILMRAGLYENLKVDIVGGKKNSCKLVLFPAKEEKPPMPDGHAAKKKDDDDEAKPVTFMFRFGKAPTADEFKKIVLENC